MSPHCFLFDFQSSYTFQSFDYNPHFPPSVPAATIIINNTINYMLLLLLMILIEIINNTIIIRDAGVEGARYSSKDDMTIGHQLEESPVI